MFPTPDALRRESSCKICRFPLSNPTTLHCAHSVCSSHLLSANEDDGQQCPLPDCRPGQPTLLNPSSSVAFLPPPSVSFSLSSDDHATATSAAPEPRLDVTLNKLLSLFDRAEAAIKAEADPSPFLDPPPQDLSDTDSENDDELGGHNEQEEHPRTTIPAATSPSPTRQRQRELSLSNSPPHRPSKRRRRYRSPADDDQHSTDNDRAHPDHLLSHLTRQSQHSPQHPSSHSDSGSSSSALDKFEKELLTELTCEICLMLLYQPVTTPCQHTFCYKCLHRTLDHKAECPLCRQEFPGYDYFQDHPYNQTILSIILKAFPDLYSERGLAIEAEERDARLDTPIFVCQLSFPGMPTLLHFFEPRYRLMLRRCLASPNPSFGMIMPPRTASPDRATDYGTMLEIKSVQMLSDGRSMVETWGTHRFRILERGSLDGYMVGRIESIEDYPEELDTAIPSHVGSSFEPEPEPESESLTRRPSPTLLTRILPTGSSSPSRSPSRTPKPPPTIDELMAICHAFLAQLRAGTAPWVVQRLNNTYGRPPSDAKAFSFWVALVLPIDEHEKAKLLPLKSARLRLRLVVHWIEQLNDNWWFSRGCSVL